MRGMASCGLGEGSAFGKKKRPVNLLHPILVHFPVAFFTLEFFLLAAWLMKKYEGRGFAALVFRLGYAILIFSALTGFRNSGGFGNMGPAVWRHFLSAAALFGTATVKLAGETFWPAFFETPAVLLFSSFTNVTVTLVTAFLGGWIVYGS